MHFAPRRSRKPAARPRACASARARTLGIGCQILLRRETTPQATNAISVVQRCPGDGRQQDTTSERLSKRDIDAPRGETKHRAHDHGSLQHLRGRRTLPTNNRSIRRTTVHTHLPARSLARFQGSKVRARAVRTTEFLSRNTHIAGAYNLQQRVQTSLGVGSRNRARVRITNTEVVQENILGMTLGL